MKKKDTPTFPKITVKDSRTRLIDMNPTPVGLPRHVAVQTLTPENKVCLGIFDGHKYSQMTLSLVELKYVTDALMDAEIDLEGK